MSFIIKKVLYSTSPMWQAGVETLEELDALERERLDKARAESFNSACRAIINAKPLYPHPGYRDTSEDN